MKKLTLLFFVGILLSGCGPSKDDALAYDDNMQSQFSTFSNIYALYAVKANGHNTQDLEDYRTYCCNVILFSLDTLKKIQDFEDNSSYKNSLLNYLQVTQNTMKEQDRKKIQLLFKDSLMTAADSESVRSLTKETNFLSNQAFLQFLEEQKKFREKYKIADLVK